MDCQELKLISAGFLEDVIPLDSKDEVREHLRNCPACSTMIFEMKKMRTALRSATTKERCPAKLLADITQKLFTQNNNNDNVDVYVNQHAGKLVDV